MKSWILFWFCIFFMFSVIFYFDFKAENKNYSQYYNTTPPPKSNDDYEKSMANIVKANKRYSDSFYKTPEGIKWRKDLKIRSEIERRKFIKDSVFANREYKAIEKIMEKYDCTQEQAQLIKSRSVSIGMSKEMCIAAWGKPYDINTTTAQGYKQEQWVYGIRAYLYFDKTELLVVIQN